MIKTWDQRRNLQVIKMRRENAKTAISSLRYFRNTDQTSFSINMKGLESEVNAIIQLYRQTNKVLCKNI